MARRGRMFLMCCSFSLAAMPSQAQEKQWKKLDEECVNLSQQRDDERALGVCQQGLAFAQSNFGNEHRNTADSMTHIGEIYTAEHRYSEAEPLLRQALATFEKATGPEHPDVAWVLNNLAILLRLEDKPEEAEPLYRRALAIVEKARGPSDPQIGPYLNDLSMVCEAQGKYAEAESVSQRALGFAEKANGPKHPNVAAVLIGLARAYRGEGKYAEAEAALKRAIQILEKSAAPDSLVIGPALTNLAKVYQAQGRYAEVEPLVQRALETVRVALGPENPTMAQVLDVLAGLAAAKGESERAVTIYQQSLAIREKAFGPNDPAVASSLEPQAVLLRKMNRGAEADKAEARIRDIRAGTAKPEPEGKTEAKPASPPGPPDTSRDTEEITKAREKVKADEAVYGPQKEDVAFSLGNLMLEYARAQRFAEAQAAIERAIAIQERTRSKMLLGPIGGYLEFLAKAYEAAGEYTEAEPVRRRQVEFREKHAGPESGEAVVASLELGGCLASQGKFPAAEQTYQRALRIGEKSREAGWTLSYTLDALAKLYILQGKYAEAEPMYQRFVQIDEKKYGRDSWQAVESADSLAELYVLEGKYVEAEGIYRRAVDVLQKDKSRLTAVTSPNVESARKHLADLCARQGKYAEAEKVCGDAYCLAGVYRASGRKAEAAAILEKMLTTSDRVSALQVELLLVQAQLYAEMGRYAEAETSCRAARDIRENGWGPNQPEIVPILETCSLILRKLNREAEAAELEARAKNIRSKHPYYVPPKMFF